MTMERILTLAWREQLGNWAREKEMCEKHPSDTLALLRERKAWQELHEIEEISRMLTGKANEHD